MNQTGTQVRMDMKSLMDDLSKAGRDMWLAGLGAVATVEEETRSVFRTLVDKGKAYEAHDTMIERAAGQAAERVRGLRKRMESGFQDTSQAMLHRIGVPSHTEIETLISRVEQLTAKVEAMSRKEGL